MCTRDKSYQNSKGTQPITNMSIYKRKFGKYNTEKYNTEIPSSCVYKEFFPNFKPIIRSFSTYTSETGVYTVVNVLGQNFLPPSYGETYVNFGSTFTEQQITFYNSFNISFVVPLNAVPDEYVVTIVNIYNCNFSPQINQTFPGSKNVSEPVTYLIT